MKKGFGNPIAKNLWKNNKPKTFVNKKQDYNRTENKIRKEDYDK